MKQFQLPLISILIANYNNSRYLKRCINSCLKQTYKNFEIIVFDDASTDDSIKQLKKFKDIKYLVNKKKKTGIPSYDSINSYRTIFNISKGEIICFLDSDDFFVREKLKTVVDFFSNNPQAQYVQDFPIKFNQLRKFPIKKKNFSFSRWPFFSPTSCLSVKKELLDTCFKKLCFKKFEDIWLDYRIASYNYFVRNDLNSINQGLTYYFQNSFNQSSKFKFLGKNWWLRRLQAHLFISNYLINKNYFSLDYFLTRLIVKIINFFINFCKIFFQHIRK